MRICKSNMLNYSILVAGMVLLKGCDQNQVGSTVGDIASSDHPGIVADVELTDAQVEELVRRSYQYVATYNVNNKIVPDPDNQFRTDTEIVDQTREPG